MGFSATVAIFLFSLIIFLFIIYFGSGALMYSGLLSHRMYKRQAKLIASDNYQSELKKKTFNYEGEAWFYKMKPVETIIQSRNNDILHGYTIPALEQSNLWVVCLHGYTGSPDTMGPFGHKFHKAGFNLIYYFKYKH